MRSLALMLLLVLPACSQRTVTTDSGRMDGARADSARGDGPVKKVCTPVGAPCKHPDPCAIDPRCAPDGTCKATSFHNCDDGLACTDDKLDCNLGLCSNIPKKGWCALAIKVSGKTTLECFKYGDLHPEDPCLTCSQQYQTKWAPASGGPCDDKDACTTADTCVAGICKGTPYGSKCSDGFACTDDGCDGKGGCLPHVIKAGWCLNNGVCDKEGTKHPSGTCLYCLSTTSTTAWSARPGYCCIAGKEYVKGAKSPDKKVCDPAKDPFGWS